MKQIILLALLTVLYIPFVSAQQLPDTINAEPFLNLIGQADEASADGRLHDAEDALAMAIALYPDNPHVPMLLSNIGMYRYSRGAVDSALVALDEAAIRAPRSVTIALNRADVYRAAGRMADAYRELSRVLSLDSTLTEPRMQHGVLALSFGRDSVAVARRDLESLSIAVPNGIETATLGSLIMLDAADYAGALKYLDQVIALDPTNTLRLQRAYCRLMTDDLPGTSEDVAEGLRQTIDTDPREAAEYYIIRSMLNQKWYRPDDAEQDAQTARRLLNDR